MVSLANNDYLDKLIKSQQSAIRYYVIFALGLVVLGIVIIIIAFISPSWLASDTPLIPDTFKGLFGMGGAFVSSLSAFQIKEILSRKEKIQAFETIKEQVNSLKGVKKADSQERLEELIWKVLEKTALS